MAICHGMEPMCLFQLRLISSHLSRNFKNKSNPLGSSRCDEGFPVLAWTCQSGPRFFSGPDTDHERLRHRLRAVQGDLKSLPACHSPGRHECLPSHSVFRAVSTRESLGCGRLEAQPRHTKDIKTGRFAHFSQVTDWTTRSQRNGLSDSFLLRCGRIESVAWHPNTVGHISFGPNRPKLTYHTYTRIHLHAAPNPTCSRWYDHKWLIADLISRIPPLSPSRSHSVSDR